MICPACGEPIGESSVPVRFCARCGFELISGRESAPSLTGAETRAKEGGMVWDRLGEVGLLEALFSTWRAVMFGPGRFFASLSPEPRLSRPLLYAVLVGSIGIISGSFWGYMLERSDLFSSLFEGTGGMDMDITITTGLILAAPFLAAFQQFIFSGILHICLLCTGGNRSGYHTTFSVVAFSASTQVLSIIPFIGSVLGSVWSLALIVIGLKTLHGISALRAVIAILLPVLFFCCLGMLALLAIFGLLSTLPFLF